HAFYLLDHEDDAARARVLLEQATDEAPRDSSLWLALELIAGKLGDSELRERSLLARASLTDNLHWKALLLLSLAEQRITAGDHEPAERALEEAIQLGSAATFDCLATLVGLARKTAEHARGVRAQVRIAEAIQSTLLDATQGARLGVPPHLRNAAGAADAWLSSAELARESGASAQAIEYLDRALALANGDPLLLRARFDLADAAGDTAGAARLASNEIERGASGAHAASLWLRVAESRAAEGDGPGALESVSQALKQDPASIAARALQLDLLGMGDDPQAFASALEAAAECLPSDSAKARFYLLSADVWARQCRDTQGARAALSQAGMYGASPGVVARLARLLSAIAEDSTWYEEATRRLIAQGANESEHAGLWFELARARALRGERTGTAQALAGLAAAPAGAWLGNALTAYALDLLPERANASSESTSDALTALSNAETDPDTARALRLVLALRALVGGRADVAREELARLHGSEPADVVVVRALSALETAQGERVTAANALTASAAALHDPDLAAAFDLEAGMLYWQAGDRKAAIERFATVSAQTNAGNALLGWALTAAESSDLAARRRAIEATAESAPDLAAMDRFALEVARGGDVNAARHALSAAVQLSGSELHGAALLARALWSPNGSEEDERKDALEEIAQNPGSAALARAAVYGIELARTANGADTTLLEAARNWAMVDSGLVPALEWLGAATHSGDVESEIEARRALAQRLSAPLGAALEASAALVALLSGQDLPKALSADLPA
ncbi:MAG TPA: hypothetical protein VGC79_17080, partial [Polyangiaceae bacterium]